MKRLAILLIAMFAFLSLSRAASAQETYSIDVSAAQEATIEWDRIRQNTDTCASGGLPASCTQAQIRAVVGHSTDVIYTADTDGRAKFLKKVWILDRLYVANVERQRRDTLAFCTWWNGLSQGNKDTQCVSTFGLSAGCLLCQ
jgi:hypothetical protein